MFKFLRFVRILFAVFEQSYINAYAKDDKKILTNLSMYAKNFEYIKKLGN